ncbi:MAG: hypothetical protein A3I05_03345 [Deltaproteobacteria bacterium RIFCSPLOWO2_02_FULL_44_10]|nr:MAG: hypothetical protein A3C46_02920 [Deltaproteobacteria bacterium RIFCSPHIGHO2_02_FULL_44_16]OGQ46208.1 MAG: hypothetical protein A3I05_03345 [Deltaproteobacteria bacterium RIFCSPLOWO2_02_FULL_44_10]
MAKRSSSPSAESLGYPEIEALLDSENFNELNDVFSKVHDALDDISRKKRGLKKGRDAQKVMTALEMTMELFRELLSIKYTLQEKSKNKK